MYDDATGPARQQRPAQGQRCPACGHAEPDLQARFCGVCGAALGGAPASGGQVGYPAPAAPPAQFPGQSYDAPARRTPTGPPAPYAPAPGAQGAAYSPSPATYAVPQLDLVGAGQIGAIVSAVFSLLPCLLAGWIVASVVSGLRWVLDSWTAASIRIPIPIAALDVPVNYIDLFRLRSLYDGVIFWDDRLWLTFGLTFLIPWLFSIAVGALFGGMLAAIYNAVGKSSGGMRVTLVPTQALPAGQAGTGGAWTPPPGPPSGPPQQQGWSQQQGWQPDRRP